MAPCQPAAKFENSCARIGFAFEFAVLIACHCIYLQYSGYELGHFGTHSTTILQTKLKVTTHQQSKHEHWCIGHREVVFNPTTYCNYAQSI